MHQSLSQIDGLGRSWRQVWKAVLWIEKGHRHHVYSGDACVLLVLLILSFTELAADYRSMGSFSCKMPRGLAVQHGKTDISNRT